MVFVMKVGSSSYTALTRTQKGFKDARKSTADLASATQMKNNVDKLNTDIKTGHSDESEQIKPTNNINKKIGTIIDVKV